jgi:hypothetical protein
LIVKSPAAFITSPASIDSISDRLASSRREVGVNSRPPASGSKLPAGSAGGGLRGSLPGKRRARSSGQRWLGEFDVGRLAGAGSAASGSMAQSGARRPGDGGNLIGWWEREGSASGPGVGWRFQWVKLPSALTQSAPKREMPSAF